MSEITDMRVRTDAGIKAEANAVLAAPGLTASDAKCMMMTRIAADKALPFEPFRPTAETIEAMVEARSGTLKRFASIDALMRDLAAPA